MMHRQLKILSCRVVGGRSNYGRGRSRPGSATHVASGSVPRRFIEG